MLKTLVLAAAALSCAALAQAKEEKHSALEVSSKIDGDKLSLSFKVVPGKDMIVNFEAPWKLEIKKAEGLSFAKTTLQRPDMDDKLPGYVLQSTAAPASSSGEVEYSAIVFVCDKDKTRCFREVHAGKHGWKKPA